MKSDLVNVLKSELAKGLDPDELYVMLEKAEDEYKAEVEAKKKEDQKQRVREELKERAAKDVFDAYAKYFNAIYPTSKLPKDAINLFNAELKFIDFMMTGGDTTDKKERKTMDDLYGDLLKALINY